MSAKPDVFKCTLNRETDRFVLLACDGLWNALSPEQACAFVHAKLLEHDASLPDVEPAKRYQPVVNALVNEAIHQGSTDNVSCVLVVLRW